MNHILSFSPAEQAQSVIAITSPLYYCLRYRWPTAVRGPAAASSAPKKEKDDDDLFGEDEDDEAAREADFDRRAKIAQANIDAKKKAQGKDKEVMKSMIVIEVKPWDDETDMEEMKKHVLEISMPGLAWGKPEIREGEFTGVKKLCIAAVIEDDVLHVEDLEERVTALDQWVQSMDIVASVGFGFTPHLFLNFAT